MNGSVERRNGARCASAQLSHSMDEGVSVGLWERLSSPSGRAWAGRSRLGDDAGEHDEPAHGRLAPEHGPSKVRDTRTYQREDGFRWPIPPMAASSVRSSSGSMSRR
eukprot:TRINITY_DN86695_c0_g1_i2.p3 TRINITY_DN86695_c0_g1~~TRINITY_DN86695_c0_g1_i2.p3  ORF type:complete len:107 (-),score=8.71 TRINITY_DN86695_c0_g1_i2:383-703(-)